MRRHLPAVVLCSTAVLVVLSGCDPDGAPAAGSSAAVAPSSSAAAAASAEEAIYAAIKTARCADGPFDLSTESAAIAKTQAQYPRVTDRGAAVVLSLLPDDIVSAAGLSGVVMGERADRPYAYVVDNQLAVKPLGDVAPAEAAAVTMQILGTYVGAQSAKLDVLIDAEVAGGVGLAVGLDTYIHLARARPQTLQGNRMPKYDFPNDSKARAEGKGGSDEDLGRYGLSGVTGTAFGAAPAFWQALTAYMGDEYRESEDNKGFYELGPAVSDKVRLKFAPHLAPAC
jgi:hypothetical protein